MKQNPILSVEDNPDGEVLALRTIKKVVFATRSLWCTIVSRRLTISFPAISRKGAARHHCPQLFCWIFSCPGCWPSRQL
jgi:hypothetical protein